ncbi:MAG TPA: efflux RND transporter periplasmic adaptor subunit [Anaerolineae bacterium]|nr:efflux RND transporter periplasmic adaptor subunit [Anaerolineae bacterium]
MNRILTAAVIVAIWSIYGCENGEESHFTGSGTIEATEIMVSAMTRGKVNHFTLKEGDYVNKGYIIAEIDVESLELQRAVTASGLGELEWNKKIVEKELETAAEAITQAEITLSGVQKNHDRIAHLFKDNAATMEQMDKSDTELELAVSRLRSAVKQLESIKTRKGSLKATREKIEANLRLLDRQIEDGTVTSPVDGVVIEKFVEQGEVVNFGSPVCTIANISSVWLIIYVGEEDLGKITLGGKARIQIDSYPERYFEGVVTWISPRAEFTPKNVQTKESRVDLVYAVKIVLDNDEGIFKIGMPADAYIEGL